MNNLEVAEDWKRLIVYGGRGKAARDWDSYFRIVDMLETLEGDETLVVQSGKPVAIWPTHEWSPRVLISNSMLVPHWSTLEHFNELEARGPMMYGQMTAGSWCNIGSQGIVQGTYETFATLAKMKFGGTLKGRVTITGGLGMFSGIMPHCITLNGGVGIGVEIDPDRIARRLDLGFVHEVTEGTWRGRSVTLKVERSWGLENDAPQPGEVIHLYERNLDWRDCVRVPLEDESLCAARLKEVRNVGLSNGRARGFLM